MIQAEEAGRESPKPLREPIRDTRCKLCADAVTEIYRITPLVTLVNIKCERKKTRGAEKSGD